MSHMGFGVMVSNLSGNEASVRAYTSALNKTISALKMEENRLQFLFSDGSDLFVFDDGQSCCESRYMVTDDNLEHFVGAQFLGAEIKDAPEVENGSEVHEVQFLSVATSKGHFTVSNHNEHNGYYGGFAIRCYTS